MTLPMRAPDRKGPRFHRVVKLVTSPPERVKCPNGHTIHANGRTIGGTGMLVCGYRDRGGLPCNEVMYTGSAIKGDDGCRYRIEIHVDYDEITMMEEHHMGLTASLAYLGVPWPAYLINPETSSGR